ncbi:hypothetical protein [Parasitella parasitica]|uniref:3'-5' exonuclease domain-containing protein n=1 Tax=Parasitella parasitica TaxID=35722 RepID=A0A0B7NWI0_9FUNG|nr:hypothetical protein [Parasitella parasitica]
MLRLPKTPTIRCGNWEAVNLSGEQQKYAALDAWVSLEIYNRAKNLPRVNQKVNRKSLTGTFVAIYATSSKRAAASGYGYICDPSQVEDDKALNLNDDLICQDNHCEDPRHDCRLLHQQRWLHYP